MIKWFDYFYYRVYQWYEKRDPHPKAYASGAVSLFQSFLLLNTFLCFEYLLKINSKDFIGNNYGKVMAAVVILILIVINFFRYDHASRYDELRLIYASEEASKRESKGRICIVLFTAALIIPFVYGFLKHSLKVI